MAKPRSDLVWCVPVFSFGMLVGVATLSQPTAYRNVVGPFPLYRGEP